jgi:hypothetical protein
VLFVAGGVVAILQPWKGRLGPIETANLLGHRLGTADQFDCHEPAGMRNPDEPSWDYICLDLTHPEHQAYLVKTSGHRITVIQSAG